MFARILHICKICVKKIEPWGKRWAFDMKISISDGIIIIGLILMGTGLFFWLGKGIALTVVGSLVALIGVGVSIESTRAKIREQVRNTG